MLSVSRLTRRFHVAEGSVTALRDLSFEVQAGEFFVLVGASGSGKTTLLRCVAGLEVPDAGEIRIDGQVVSSDSPRVWTSPQKRRLGMVFQSYAVWPHLTVYDNVALPLREGVQRIERSEVDRRVRHVLDLVELSTLADRSATLLSGGQQQRVALARAIAVNSRMVLMDEPLSNLDARLREDVRGRIRELAKKLGSTVLYVTHDQVEAMAMADRIALLRAGQLLQVGSPTEVYRRPVMPEVAEFFGQVNWLEGTLDGLGRITTELGTLRVAAPAGSGTRFLVGIRPESLVPDTGPDAMEMRVVSSAFLGDQVVAQLAAGERILAAKGRALPAVAGTLVQVAVDPDEVMVFPFSYDAGEDSHAQVGSESGVLPYGTSGRSVQPSRTGGGAHATQSSGS
jgi:ABC-type Fe3+/spermidine/putrescine transport system ATPase subunit